MYQAIEGKFFGKYLCGGEISDEITLRYSTAINHLRLSEQYITTDLLTRFVQTNPKFIGFVDAGLALILPSHPIRKKLITLCAILETDPRYVDLFLPKSYNYFEMFLLCTPVIKSIFKAAIGLPLVFILIKLDRFYG